MALKEKLLENERLIKECQFEVEELQSTMSYQLGYEETIVPPVESSESSSNGYSILSLPQVPQIVVPQSHEIQRQF